MIGLSILFTIFLIIRPQLSSSHVNCSFELDYLQFSSLQSLYYSGSGDQWRCPGNPWNFSQVNTSAGYSAPCIYSWKGITCACNGSDYYTITELSLPICSFEGSIPDNIFQLSDLYSLDMSTNSISQIPDTFDRMSNLTLLNLMSCQLRGQIGPNIYNISTLQSLEIQSNYWSGQLPSQLAQLTNLKRLYVSSMFLTGTIPDSIYTLTKLMALGVQGSHLTGKLELIDRLKNLKVLSLNGDFSGSFPSNIMQLTNLKFLQLRTDMLTGEIPSTISQLTCLEYLELTINSVEGTLPSTLGALRNLQSLNFYIPSVGGTLPSTIGQLSSLLRLNIIGHSLTGTFPETWAQMKNLISIQLTITGVGGSLPESLFNFSSSLQDLSVSSNMLGSIPESVSSLVSLSIFGLSSPSLTGSIPPSIVSLPKLASFSVYSEKITGKIPVFDPKVNLQSITLSSPLLTGTIPSTIGLLTSMITIYIVGNSLTGTLPSSMSNLSAMAALYLDISHLSSTLPSNFFSNMKSLEYLTLFGDLSGPFPSWSHCTSLANVAIDNNGFSGNLPIISQTSLTQISLMSNRFSGSLDIATANMTNIELANNYFSGPLPQSIGRLSGLFSLSLTNNFFSGKFDFDLSAFSMLQFLLLGSNLFTGKLDGLTLPSTDNAHLEIINLSNNLFSGSIESFLFDLSALKVLILSSNCFSGSLSQDLCYRKCYDGIQAIIFDGLSSNDNCPQNIDINREKPSFMKGILQASLIAGSIPECLWSAPNIQTLHFAGNGLTGHIPSDGISPSLNEVSISNNKITGTIPQALQSRVVSELLLSNNRLKGSLSSDFTVSALQKSLTLSSNRLSGEIPHTFTDTNASMVSDFDVLTGNLFACSNSDIPSNDPDSRSYICGSSELNQSEYFYIAILCIMILTFLIVYFDFNAITSLFPRFVEFRKQCRRYIQLGLSTTFCKDTIHADLLILTSRQNLMFFTICTVCILVFGVIVYVSLKDAGDYSLVEEQYSWLYSSAYLAGIAPVAVICIFVLVVLLGYTYSVRKMSVLCRDKLQNITYVEEIQGIEPKELHEDKADSKIPLTVIGICVLLLTHAVNIIVLITANILFLNTILHNTNISESQIVTVQYFFACIKIAWNLTYIPMATSAVPMKTTNYFRNRLVMSMTNFIAAPCIASLVWNKTCFYYIFYASDNVVSEFSYNTCKRFASSGRCEETTLSSVEVSFTPPFLYSCTCGSSILVTYVPLLIYSYTISALLAPIIQYIYFRRSKKTGKFSELLDGNDLALCFSQNVVLLLTFGIASPLLALAIILTSLVQFLSFVVFVGYSRTLFANHNTLQMNLLTDATTFDESFIHTWKGSKATSHLVVLAVALFWGLLCFDMIAEQFGLSSGAIATLTVVMCLTIIPFLFMAKLRRIVSLSRSDSFL